MAVELDYVIGAGILLVSTIAILGFVTGWVTSTEGKLRISELEERADYIGQITQEDIVLNGTSIGLSSWAYASNVIVNNTQNQNFSNELVSFDMNALGYGDVDLNSIAILDQGTSLSYQRSGTRIDFVGSVPIGVKVFRAFWDDDSNFTDRSSSLGSWGNNLTEVVSKPERFSVVQYRRMQYLSYIDYNSLREGFDWRISIDSFSYGTQPNGPNVIVRKIPVIYQTASGDVLAGQMILEVG